MKYFLIFLLTPFYSLAQTAKVNKSEIEISKTISDLDPTFEETLDYIKRNVNEFQYIDPSREVKYSTNIEVDKYGKLTSSLVIGNEISKIVSYYLKSVDTIYSDKIHSDMFRMFLRCKTSHDITIIDKKKNNKLSTDNETALFFSSSVGTDKIKNALNYLVKLAKENPYFREKDLF